MTGKASGPQRALLVLAAGVGVMALGWAQEHPPAGPPPTVVNMPPVDVGAASLPARAAAELKTRNEFGVFNGFHFADRLPESGITFSQQIVDDSGKHYKAVHYDHGSGMAVADVDGDGLLDVYFVTQLGRNGLWRNLGNGKFEDITEAAGVGLPDGVKVSASFADIDNDGDPDLYVTCVRCGDVLFENDGKGHFKNVTAQSGLGYVGHSSGALFFDFDRDGLLDLLLVNVGRYTTEARGAGGYYVGFEDAFEGHKFPERTEYSVLYRNLGHGRFADVSKEMGFVDGSWSGDASIADFNDDGFLDVYLLNMQGDDHYYENVGGKRFVDATDKYFPKTPWGSMGVAVFDWNNDGLFDLFVTDMHSDMIGDVAPDHEKDKFPPTPDKPMHHGTPKSIYGNAFYENRGGGLFAERSDQVNLENYWPWGVSTGDLNADGWEDVLITSSMNYPLRYGINSLLLNDRGRVFRDSAFILGIEPRRGGRTRKPWFTLDCVGEDKALKECQGRNARFVITGALGSRSSAIFDLDDDGDLDIVTNDLNSEPQVFVSDLTERRKIHWLKVRLVGHASNRDGIGARVAIRVGDRTLTKRMDGNSGYLSHSVMPLYFGLGEAEKVDGIDVLWPSGRSQHVPGPVPGNQSLEIQEDAGGPQR